VGDQRLLLDLALVAIREADLVSDGVKRWLLDLVDGRPWSFEAIYAPDPRAVRAVAEREVPPGALPPAAAIASALCAPGKRSDVQFANWHGPLPPAPNPELPGTSISDLLARITELMRGTADPPPRASRA
jgi:hypothetical protein